MRILEQDTPDGPVYWREATPEEEERMTIKKSVLAERELQEKIQRKKEREEEIKNDLLAIKIVFNEEFSSMNELQIDKCARKIRNSLTISQLIVFHFLSGVTPMEYRKEEWWMPDPVKRGPKAKARGLAVMNAWKQRNGLLPLA